MTYLDNNATTQPDPSVTEAMLGCLTEHYGNPSSGHRVGIAARCLVETARANVAALIGARPGEIVFTSGGTEADNLAILGTLSARPGKRHLVTTAVEHPAVHDLCMRLGDQGYRITIVGVDGKGRLDLDAFATALDKDTVLASVMHANNETGVMFPVREIGRLTAAHGVPLHVDAVQSASKVPLNVGSLGAQLVSISAHKMHGPKGVGALYVADSMRLNATSAGGSQERGIRTGTENVSGIVGFGEAARLASTRLRQDPPRIAALRDHLETGLLDRIPWAIIIGDRDNRLPNTMNLAFRNLRSVDLVGALDEAGICVSSGSACHSGAVEVSRVTEAMGVDFQLALGTVRFSLSRETTNDEIDRALQVVPQAVAEVASRFECVS